MKNMICSTKDETSADNNMYVAFVCRTSAKKHSKAIADILKYNAKTLEDHAHLYRT